MAKICITKKPKQEPITLKSMERLVPYRVVVGSKLMPNQTRPRFKVDDIIINISYWDENGSTILNCTTGHGGSIVLLNYKELRLVKDYEIKSITLFEDLEVNPHLTEEFING